MMIFLMERQCHALLHEPLREMLQDFTLAFCGEKYPIKSFFKNCTRNHRTSWQQMTLFSNLLLRKKMSECNHQGYGWMQPRNHECTALVVMTCMYSTAMVLVTCMYSALEVVMCQHRISLVMVICMCSIDLVMAQRMYSLSGDDMQKWSWRSYSDRMFSIPLNLAVFLPSLQSDVHMTAAAIMTIQICWFTSPEWEDKLEVISSPTEGVLIISIRSVKHKCKCWKDNQMAIYWLSGDNKLTERKGLMNYK